MNKRQIKAELIRSACYDKRPMMNMHIKAFLVFDNWMGSTRYNASDKNYLDNHYRTLILLCAESL